MIDGFDGDERYYAGLVAERLGIPIQFRDLGGKILDPAWAEACVHTAEPVSYPLNLIADRRQYQISRIILGRAVCRYIPAIVHSGYTIKHGCQRACD